MNFDIDTIIFVGFLTINVVLGLTSSRGVKTIREFAVGNKDFSTATIVATIVATWITGEFFFSLTSETYVNGLYYTWAVALGNILCFIVVGMFFAPRMGEFLGNLSIAEAMGGLFGNKVRIVTAIAGFVGASGMIAVQLKIAGLTLEYCLGISGIYGVFAAGVIITLYSSLGGIRSVTFTDIVQFFTFGTVIPLLSYVVLTNIEDVSLIKNTLTTNVLFDYKEVFDFTQPRSLYYLFLFVYIAIPAFNPTIFQRIAMAKNTRQVGESFIVSGFVCLFLILMMGWIGVLVLSQDPTLNPNNIVKHLIYGYSFTGLGGLLLAGIMAMVMSTADSFVNATSVLVVHDFCKPLKFNFVKNELRSARIASVLIGAFSILLALRSGSLLQLVIATNTIYMPIVTVPFIMALLGFRTSGKSVLIGMGAGLITVILWDSHLKFADVNSLVPAMFANLLFLMSSHYILRQPGGWVGIKDMKPVLQLRQERKMRCKKFWDDIRNFSLFEICKKNSPKGDGFISILGFFVMISVFGSTHTMPLAYYAKYAHIIDIFYPIGLCSSCGLISYPLWLQPWKDSGAVGLVWNIIMFFVLICFSFFMILLSNFGEIQLMVFLVNIIILASIVTWRWALFTIIFGTSLTIFYHSHYIAADIAADIFSSQFKIIYMLLLLSSTLLIFLKPKQDQAQFMDDKIHYLEDESKFHKNEISSLLGMKNEFIRNVEHESKTPITGISSMAEVLEVGYDKFSDNQRKEAIRDIAKSSERLNSWANNLVHLSKLSTIDYELKTQKVNLGDLIHERLQTCIKLHIYDKDLKKREFILNIDPNITLNCDKYYISLALDNIITNAIQYCKEGRITINLHQNKKTKKIEFSIEDEGIGIPKAELYDIFGAFTTSSKTTNSAGGRGIGLAIVKKVIEAHGGSIVAESDGEKGAMVSVRL